MNIFETFRVKWIKEELDVQPGCDENNIIKCFEIFGITPHKDLILLYSTLNGIECMDDEYFTLWTLKQIIEENSSDSELERALKYGVSFGDYCVNCWEYRVNNKGEVLIDYDNNREPILRSNSVSDFFELMRLNPNKALD
ncbi:MAG: hypothetical protein HRU38_16035 [Saccharospirillaceae bacterium]|nr:hypothetical protein [Pseudomonadales bacterium]NRB80152.1 hypothetical protein [Saccharospirillaceae bacterium]